MTCNKSCKIPGSPNAIGYWGRDIYTRIEQEQIPGKIEALLQDKLRSRGKPVHLWTQVTPSTPNSLECSCVKSTTDRSDITCNSCYGTKLIPGYAKVFHETIYVASITQGITLINTQLDTSIKPHRILLADDEITGSITSPRLQFNNPSGFDWDFRLDAPNIQASNLVSASFSTDGITFYPIEQINDQDKKPTGIGGIYLRVSLSRTSLQDRSPEFQILRIRHAINNNPYILILRPQYTELPVLMQYGNRTENLGERFWTMPLNFFDKTIPANTPSARIQENSFYQRITGINQTARYVTTKLLFNEEFGRFTHQSFEPRRSQPEEVYSALVF